ncbi:MAG TPA: Nramp family divalent metal transporter [Microlunatus sp.]|nr:Nramp family divalent metal transporter [Microlunatus sp.]
MTTAQASSRTGWRGALGPAFITAALVFGPGSITTASSMGAGFSYQLLWVPVIATVLMLCFVDLAVRIGLTTDTGPVGTIAGRLGRVIGVAAGIGAFLVTASFQAGNSAGTGAAGTVLFGSGTAVFAAVFTLLAIGFLWLPAFYRYLERTMVVIILLMLVIFVITAIVSRPDPVAMLGGLLPTLPQGSTSLVVGAAATTFSVVGALYQIQLVREKGWGPDDYRTARRDAVVGSLILGSLSMVIMIAAAAVLHPAGVEVTSPVDMATILTPTVGRWATVLFAVGLWAAAFSSLVGNSTIGGGMLAGALRVDRGGLRSVPVKLCITAVMVLGGIVAIAFGRVPLQLIVTAQAVTILIAPLIGIVMLVLARHADRGRLRIGVPQLVLALLGLAFLFTLAGNYLINLL